MTDYAATPTAEQNREHKALTMARWCYDHGHTAEALEGWELRERRHMARKAGVNPPNPNSPTWVRVAELLRERADYDARHGISPSRTGESESKGVTGEVLTCDHWLGERSCGATPARPYMNGVCCAAHTPAALAGHPEPAPPQDSTLAALLARQGKAGIGTPMSASQLIDDQAVASGKRRSSPDVYRAARDRMAERKAASD